MWDKGFFSFRYDIHVHKVLPYKTNNFHAVMFIDGLIYFLCVLIIGPGNMIIWPLFSLTFN